ncbi:DMT family transporter [Sulfitobacter mediterraneus]|uniref:DMT family transporter n=1 Tax=Sulfitobacter mediterraneus TaxID=83219 RepID=UPI000EA2A1D7|nr:DMT family transporter [Sulfitobacter mediterraneus]
MHRAEQTTRTTGILLVVVSAVVFSTAGIFTKSVTTAAWGVIFWRGVAAAGFTLAYLVMRGQLRSEVRAFGWPAFWITAMMAAGTAAFIPAFKHSSVANVALIYAAAPFIAAGLSWICIKEAPGRRVMLASGAAFGGVLVILSGSVGGGALKGDFLALFMTLMMAGVMVAYRMYPEATAALPAALSSVVLLPLALTFGDPMATPAAEMPVLIAFGLVFAVASVTLSEGARRLPSAETALLSTLEMPLAPVLAFALLSEVPKPQVLLGGVVIFAAVIWSQRRSAAPVVQG